ncbi:hypothetical protein COOONC_00975 [Cooperia oncophora]
MSMISSISSEQLLRTPSRSGDPQDQMDLDERRTEAENCRWRAYPKKVEELGDNWLRAASSQGENDGPVGANNGISAIDRMRSTQGSSKTMSNEDSRNEARIRLSLDTGEDRISGFSMSDYTRTIALPDVQPFGGRPHECFKRFLSSLNIKHPSDRWKDSSRLQFFQSFLRKNALTIFETVPVKAMKKRTRVDGNIERVKALADLRKLTLRDDQLAAEFCLLLEGLTNRAYPDVPQEVTALQKAEILSRQLANWGGSYCFMEALETSAAGEVYGKVKETALWMEKSIRAAAKCRNALRTKPTQRFKSNWERSKDEPRSFLGLNKFESETNAERTQESRSKKRNKQQEAEQETAAKDLRPCYNCAKQGHFDCRLSARQNKTPTPTEQTRKPSESFASRLKGGCALQIREPTRSQLTISVKVFGMSAEALVDTGPQATIFPLMLPKKAIDAGMNLDDYVERIPSPKVKVKDASGNCMKFLDTIRVSVILNGQEESIPVYVGKGFDEVVILGTNALERFIMKLVQDGEEKDIEHSNEKEDVEVAEIKQRIFILLGASKLLSVTCAHTYQSETAVFSAQHPLLIDGVCHLEDHEAILNTSDQQH